MLRQVRGALKGVGAWFIIILLILAFALWGVPEMRNFAQRTPLKVGQVNFSQQSVLEEYNRQIASKRNETGRSMTRQEAMEAGVPDQVVASLTSRSILEQEAGRLGLVMPRNLVRDFLHKDERFQNPGTGRFDEFALQSIISSNGLTARQFEAMLKQDLLRSQLVESVAEGGPAPFAMVDAAVLRQIEQRRVAYLTITDDLAGVPAEPTPDALRQYYEANQAEFMAPEYRRFTAIILDQVSFTEGLGPDEDELLAAYEANRARLYEMPERRTIYQITYDSEAEARAATAALRQNRPFEDLASAKGLSLNSVTFSDIERQAVLDPNVAEAAFSPDLDQGDIADPVQGLFGWTVVQIAGVTPPETRTFEDVRDDLVLQFTEQDTRRRIFEAVEAIEEARDSGASLAAAADAAGVSAIEFGPVDSMSFAPGGDGVIVDGIPGEVLSEAFRLEEGEEALASDLADDTGYFFVQVNEITRATLRPYEEVIDHVEQKWRASERGERIAGAVKQVTDAIQSGQSFDEAAAPFNRAVLRTTVSRGQPNNAFSDALAEETFNAELGSVLTGNANAASAQTIVEVRDIAFARNQVGAAERAAFRQYLSFQLNQELLEAYISSLRADYGVHLDETALASIFSDAQ